MFGKDAVEGEDFISKLNVDKDLAKAAAKKSMASSAGNSAGADLGGRATEALTGSSIAGDVMKAGIGSGFNPVIMGAAAGIGILSAAQKRKERKRQAQAKAKMEEAKGMEKKAEIQGEMAEAISDVLGGSGRIRGVNL